MNYPDELLQKMHAASMQSTGRIGGISAMSQSEALKPPSRDVPEIEGCLNRANNALERLHNRVSALGERLRPAIRANTLGQACGAKPQEAMSPLGDSIAAIENGIDAACDRLDSLLLSLAL